MTMEELLGIVSLFLRSTSDLIKEIIQKPGNRVANDSDLWYSDLKPANRLSREAGVWTAPGHCLRK